MESEQLQEDSSTLLDWILKLCPQDHQIIPLYSLQLTSFFSY